MKKESSTEQGRKERTISVSYQLLQGEKLSKEESGAKAEAERGQSLESGRDKGLQTQSPYLFE